MEAVVLALKTGLCPQCYRTKDGKGRPKLRNKKKSQLLKEKSKDIKSAGQL